jgi:hypothetical protein
MGNHTKVDSKFKLIMAPKIVGPNNVDGESHYSKVDSKFKLIMAPKIAGPNNVDGESRITLKLIQNSN